MGSNDLQYFDFQLVMLFIQDRRFLTSHLNDCHYLFLDKKMPSAKAGQIEGCNLI
jgi:hypothetical protein